MAGTGGPADDWKAGGLGGDGAGIEAVFGTGASGLNSLLGGADFGSGGAGGSTTDWSASAHGGVGGDQSAAGTASGLSVAGGPES